MWPARNTTLGAPLLALGRCVRGSRAEGRWPGALRKARGRPDVWRVALGSLSRIWLEVPVGRGDALFSLQSVCLKRARCETLGRFDRGACWGCAPSSGCFFLLLAPDIAGGARWETGHSHGETCQKGDGVSVGTCCAGQLRHGFARIQGWPAVNAPSLPLEFSVRGSEA